MVALFHSNQVGISLHATWEGPRDAYSSGKRLELACNAPAQSALSECFDVGMLEDRSKHAIARLSLPKTYRNVAKCEILHATSSPSLPHRHIDLMLGGAAAGLFITSVGVPEDAHHGIVREHAREALGGLGCTVGDDDLTGVL